ncbi:MAG: type I-E CRISPR-associated endonuclease Cas1 [Syntrophomonadaceae bacterium]|nr:type I-E CRISPR-associated endonuclease Cas1 [Syntrophomonadaceae bacterium]
MKDLRALPKIRDSLSYLYLEHCKIEQDGLSIAIFDANGKTPIPCAALCVLMLGPGTSITHAAIRALAGNGCLVQWTGEESVRFYASGTGETRNASNLYRQAILSSIAALRNKVIRRMYQLRFNDILSDDMTLQQIRGMEGVRVREAYAAASKLTGVPWVGRSYKRENWKNSDPVNRALSSANSCLYGVCHAAIVSIGLSPGLGFIHFGKQLSFVYDVADFYKAEVSIPLAFKIASEGLTNVENRARIACRDYFKENRVLGRIVDDINRVLDVPIDIPQIKGQLFDDDEAAPGMLWDDKSGLIDGGENYGDDGV